MAVGQNKQGGVIVLGAASDEVTGTLSIESIIIASTAAGTFTLTDSMGNPVFSGNTAANQLTIQILLNRTVNGIKATALPTGSVYVYLKKA